jgi:hypothetical protein
VAEFLHPFYKDVKVSFSLSYTHVGSGAGGFGCHAAGIARICFGYPTLQRDPNKELAPLGIGVPVLSKYAEFLKWLKSPAGEETRHQLFEEMKNKLRNYSIVFMSCPCNTDDGKPAPTAHNHGHLSIAGFATWLKAQGEFIMGSPLITNSNHLSSSFSLLRGWMWVPQHSDGNVKHIEGTGYISGKCKSALPFPEWIKFYKEYHKKFPLYDTPPNNALVDFEPNELLG